MYDKSYNKKTLTYYNFLCAIFSDFFCLIINLKTSTFLLFLLYKKVYVSCRYVDHVNFCIYCFNKEFLSSVFLNLDFKTITIYFIRVFTYKYILFTIFSFF